MANGRVLITGAAGKIGGAVTAQLLERGVATRALVHREDARSAYLRSLGAETVVADMFDVQQVHAALEGVDRLFFNLPYHRWIRLAPFQGLSETVFGLYAVTAGLGDTGGI